MRVIIFTDGACSGNPGPGGWAAAMNHEDHCELIGGHALDTTNNRMELMGVVMGILTAYKQGYDEIIINSDSAYVVNSINNHWLDRWKLNGWKTQANADVKNSDLWKKLDKLLNKCNVKLNKVKGHSGNTFNEMADQHAKKESEFAKGLLAEGNE